MNRFQERHEHVILSERNVTQESTLLQNHVIQIPPKTNSHFNLKLKMLKRFAESHPSSPEKKKSPMKDYSVNILFRRIVDCESKETLGATLEGSYCIKDWLQGKESRVLNNDGDEDYVPATGKDSTHTSVLY